MIVFSCHRKKTDPKQERYLNAIHSNQIKTNYILVVPRAGCGGCISDATFFVVKNKSRLKGDLTIVFTGVGDKKLLAVELGSSFLKNKQVKIDEKNYFLAPEIASSYPTLISIGPEDQINYVKDFSPADKKLASNIITD